MCVLLLVLCVWFYLALRFEHIPNSSFSTSVLDGRIKHTPFAVHSLYHEINHNANNSHLGLKSKVKPSIRRAHPSIPMHEEGKVT